MDESEQEKIILRHVKKCSKKNSRTAVPSSTTKVVATIPVVSLASEDRSSITSKSLVSFSSESEDDNTGSTVTSLIHPRLQQITPKSPYYCCPVCSLPFSRQDLNYEEKAAKHVLMCTKQSAKNIKPNALENKHVQEKKSNRKKRMVKERLQNEQYAKLKALEKKLDQGKTFNNRKRVVKEGIDKRKRMVKEHVDRYAPKPISISESSKSKSYLVTDPNHFLTQTWWRTPSPEIGRKKRQKLVTKSEPETEFDLQQCFVVTGDNAEKEDAKQVVARRSKDNMVSPTYNERKSSRKVNPKGFKLCCPFCNEIFKYSPWMGDVTEESMSRHVRKCSKKLFATSKRQGKQRNQNPEKKQSAEKILVPKKLNFSEEDEKQRANAFESRNLSFEQIIGAPPNALLMERRQISHLDVAFLSAL